MHRFDFLQGSIAVLAVCCLLSMGVEQEPKPVLRVSHEPGVLKT